MAKYGVINYGTSNYGEYEGYGGTFISKVYDAGATISSPVTATWVASTPTKTYQYANAIFQYSGTWTQDNQNLYSHTSAANSKVTIGFVGNSITVLCPTDSSGTVGNVTLDGVSQGTVDCYSATPGTTQVNLGNLEYAAHILEITHGGGTGSIYIREATIGATDVSIYIRSGNIATPDSSWSNWIKMDNGVGSSDVIGEQYIQISAALQTSDTTITPTLTSLGFSSKGGYTLEAVWEGIKYIDDPAFGSYDTISWNATTPAGTSVTIQTETARAVNMSDPDTADWTPTSNPYDISVQNRVVLNEPATSGSIMINLINPTSGRTTTDIVKKWTSAITKQFGQTDTTITYELWGDSATPVKIAGPYTASALNAEIIKVNALTTQKFKIKAILTRPANTASPSIDKISIGCDIDYSETKSYTNQTVSSIDGNNTGVKQLFTIQSQNFNPPAGATVNYKVQDNTGKPSTISIYFDGGVTDVTDPTKYLNAKSTTAKYYQSNTGMMKFGDPELQISIGSSWTSADGSTLPGICRYYVVNGWEYDPTTVKDNIVIDWLSNSGAYTSNPVDKVTISVTAPAGGGVVSWISDESIALAIINVDNTNTPYSHYHTMPIIPEDVLNVTYDVNIIPGTTKVNGENINIESVQSPTPVVDKIAYYFNTSTGEITISSSYKEIIITKQAWTSNKLVKGTGQCSVDKDFVSAALPTKTDKITWIDLTNDITNLQYTIDDNNQLVITYVDTTVGNQATPISTSKIVGTLKAKFNNTDNYGKYPHNRWWPSITSGYYYLNKEEYYLYTEPMKAVLNGEIITYVDSYGNTTSEAARKYVDGPRMILNLSPGPQQGAPVIIKAMKGSTPVEVILSKVSYIDPVTGAYTVYDAIHNPEPVDCFAVDYNTGTSSDAVKLIFSEHYSYLVVYYETEKYSDKHIASELEINPILSTINEGFIYVAKDIKPISTLNVNITPDSLVANGVDKVYITVEPLDRYSNLVPNSNLEIIITPDSRRNEPTFVVANSAIENFGGVRTFTYTPNVISYGDDIMYTDTIRIKELGSGLISKDENGNIYHAISIRRMG